MLGTASVLAVDLGEEVHDEVGLVDRREFTVNTEHVRHESRPGPAGTTDEDREFRAQVHSWVASSDRPNRPHLEAIVPSAMLIALSPLLLLMAACGGAVDADGDGVTSEQDCDDTDPALGEAVRWYADADGDGVGGDVSITACAQPANFVAETGDCDDTEPKAAPGRDEVCGDGLDNDCLGGDEDCARLDGVISVGEAWLELQGDVSGETCGRAVAAGEDGAWIGCTRGAENAGRVAWLSATEPAGTRSVSDGVVLESLGTGGQAGRDLAVGDADGDGVEDVLIGAYGIATVALHLGPHGASGLLTDGHALLTGAQDSEAGRGVLLHDLDHDGVDEVIVGQPAGPGHVALFWGPVQGNIAVEEADVWLAGQVDGAAAGTALASSGDADGDGLDDLLIGASRDSTGGTQAGSAALVLSPPTSISLADAQASWTGTDPYHAVGYALAGGDLDGDGYSDAVMGAYGDSLVGYYGGAVYVALGPHRGDHDIDTSDWSVLPSADSWFVGISVDVADLDGNGSLDLIIGGQGHSDYAGAAWVLYGPLTGGVAVLNADAQLEGLTPEDSAGFAVAGFGAGVLIGAYEADGTTSETGAAYWMLPE